MIGQTIYSEGLRKVTLVMSSHGFPLLTPKHRAVQIVRTAMEVSACPSLKLR
jgi:hypothetical protein